MIPPRISALLLVAAAVTIALCHPGVATAQQPRTAAAEDKALQAQLDRKLPEVMFDGVGFADAIDFLRDVSGLNLFVDWPGLEAAKVDRNAPIKVNLRNRPVRDVLAKILDQLGPADGRPRFAVDGGAAVISTPAGLERLAASAKALAAAPAGAKPRAALDKVLPEVKFDGVALGDVVDFLREVAGAPIEADWKALEAAGVDRNTPVTLRLAHVRVGFALRAIALAAGGPDRPLQVTADANTIRIGVAPKPATK